MFLNPTNATKEEGELKPQIRFFNHQNWSDLCFPVNLYTLPPKQNSGRKTTQFRDVLQELHSRGTFSNSKQTRRARSRVEVNVAAHQSRINSTQGLQRTSAVARFLTCFNVLPGSKRREQHLHWWHLPKRVKCCRVPPFWLRGQEEPSDRLILSRDTNCTSAPFLFEPSASAAWRLHSLPRSVRFPAHLSLLPTCSFTFILEIFFSGFSATENVEN